MGYIMGSSSSSQPILGERALTEPFCGSETISESKHLTHKNTSLEIANAILTHKNAIIVRLLEEYKDRCGALEAKIKYLPLRQEFEINPMAVSSQERNQAIKDDAKKVMCLEVDQIDRLEREVADLRARNQDLLYAKSR